MPGCCQGQATVARSEMQDLCIRISALRNLFHLLKCNVEVLKTVGKEFTMSRRSGWHVAEWQLIPSCWHTGQGL